ncbi:MAG: hypothetical protein ACRDRT_07520, partial [Pseudonocardiaceae bacterium]
CEDNPEGELVLGEGFIGPLDSRLWSVESSEDPTVSAVVSLSSTPDVPGMGRIKTEFSKLGFEVHAPFHASFSIGGRRSLFEKVFASTLIIDETQLPSSVTNGDGGSELPLEPLPDEIQAQVTSVAFMAPPSFPNRKVSPK